MEISKPTRRFAPATDSRLTVIFNMYHELPEDTPSQFQFNSDRISGITDSIYSRKLTIETGWVKLDLGWFEPESILGFVIFNQTGMLRSVNPTPEEQDEDKSAVIELSYPEGLIVPPRLFNVVWLHEFKEISVRSLGAPAKIQYLLVPR